MFGGGMGSPNRSPYSKISPSHKYNKSHSSQFKMENNNDNSNNIELD
jgi:hypothetical protein